LPLLQSYEAGVSGGAALRGCCAHLSADHALHRGRWLDARPFFSSGDVNEWDKEKLEAL